MNYIFRLDTSIDFELSGCMITRFNDKRTGLMCEMTYDGEKLLTYNDNQGNWWDSSLLDEWVYNYPLGSEFLLPIEIIDIDWLVVKRVHPLVLPNRSESEQILLYNNFMSVSRENSDNQTDYLGRLMGFPDNWDKITNASEMNYLYDGELYNQVDISNSRLGFEMKGLLKVLEVEKI